MNGNRISLEQQILKAVRAQGPLSGAELSLHTNGVDGLGLWQACNRSRRLRLRTVATHYLRLDRLVEGFGRISPSIYREFLTYTIIGDREDPQSVEERALALIRHIEGVNRAKVELAYRTVSGICRDLESECYPIHCVCFVLAGDVVYNMAHDVPRPERSTGRMVRGSDLDIVVIADDGFPDASLRRLDDAVFEEKRNLLMAPHIREEIDYVVKPLARVREQLRCDTFKHLLACKILREGTLLYGSESLFARIKAMLSDSGALRKLSRMEAEATAHRVRAITELLNGKRIDLLGDRSHFFYPAEESEEFT